MNEKIDLLNAYIIANVAPILEDFIFGKDIPNSVVIDSSIHIDDLYAEDSLWYKSLFNDNKKVLVVDNLDNIDKKEQEKFLELFKYRKVGTLIIPNDIVIIATSSVINQNTISDEIYSLVAHVRG